MRLPNKGTNGDTPIDEEETAKMVEVLINNPIYHIFHLNMDQYFFHKHYELNKNQNISAKFN